MYEFAKSLVLRTLRVPPEPLDPMGDVRSLKVFRASPNFFRYRLYVWIIRNVFSAFILALGAGIFFAVLLKSRAPSGEIILSFVSLIGVCIIGAGHLIVSFIMLRLDYEMRWYKISDRSLRIREGVVFVREMTMTFANIQNISISQGPIQRFFKIADLKVETAGGGGAIKPDHNTQNPVFSMHIGVFKGIDNFDEVRDMMLARLRKLRDSGLGDTDDLAGASGENEKQSGVVSNSLAETLKLLYKEASLLRQSAGKLKQI
jgi:membrane protein YdbS with pleckstrin-like domain